MVTRWKWILSRVIKRPWFRASLFSALGVGTALLALAVDQYIPDDLPARIGSDAVDNILGIIASSMLAVTTFSLTTMVSAYASATSNVTPRAIPLLVEDNTAQNALSIFIGSFIFSLVSIIALSTGAYGGKGRVVLFVMTILVILLILYALLRWIDHLTELGRVGQTSERVEKAAAKALRHHLKQPYLGCSPLNANQEIPRSTRPVHSDAIGYVQHIDMQALTELSESRGSALYLHAVPGSFVEPTRPLLSVVGLEEDCDSRIRQAFSIGGQRTFEHDPRFGISVLAEIASRALSPAVNDQGTAIDVIGRGVRVLCLLADHPCDPSPTDALHGRIYVPGLEINDLFDDFFTPIARDGAGMIEIGMRLQKALASLSRLGDARLKAAASRHARLALARADTAMTLDEDRLSLEQLAAQLKRSDEAY
jgi:uncharacterized membrane protein